MISWYQGGRMIIDLILNGILMIVKFKKIIIEEEREKENNSRL